VHYKKRTKHGLLADNLSSLATILLGIDKNKTANFGKFQDVGIMPYFSVILLSPKKCKFNEE